MPWNGAGSYTKVHDWTDDRDANIKILASRADAQDDDFAAGINSSLQKNGENTATGNQKYGGFRLTNVGAATARTDAPNTGQVQDGAFNYGVAGGTADVITLPLVPAITAYTNGQVFAFLPSADNATTTPTANVNAVAAKTIVGPGGNVLAVGAIQLNRIAFLAYNGTADNLELLNPATADIFDENGNELLQFGTTASAVNNLQTTNAATGNNPVLQAIGDDTNIGLTAQTKGTGEFLVPSTEGTAVAGPVAVLDRNSASPLAADVMGQLLYRGRSSTAVSRGYAAINADLVDPTNAAEDGGLDFQTIVAGALASRLVLRQGLYTVGATGGDQGANTINASAFHDDGVLLDAAIAATQAEQEAGTSLVRSVTPGRQHFHPSAAKAWVNFDGTGVVAINADYGVTSITDNGLGDYTVNFDTNFSTANYVVVGGGVTDVASPFDDINGIYPAGNDALAVGSCRILTTTDSGSASGGVEADFKIATVAFFGDL